MTAATYRRSGTCPIARRVHPSPSSRPSSQLPSTDRTPSRVGGVVGGIWQYHATCRQPDGNGRGPFRTTSFSSFSGPQTPAGNASVHRWHYPSKTNIITSFLLNNIKSNRFMQSVHIFRLLSWLFSWVLELLKYPPKSYRKMSKDVAKISHEKRNKNKIHY